jgi:hypothetical protein
MELVKFLEKTKSFVFNKNGHIEDDIM